MFPDFINFVSCRVMQLGFENRFILFLRLSNLDFNPFVFEPIREKLIGKFFPLLFFPLPLLVLIFNFGFVWPSFGSAMSGFGMKMGWTKDLSLAARDS